MVPCNGQATDSGRQRIPFATSGQAIRGTDYTLSGIASNSFTIPAGNTSLAVTLDATDDNAIDNGEDAIVSLLASANYQIVTSGDKSDHTTTTISDDDAADLLSLTATDSMSGGQTVTADSAEPKRLSLLTDGSSLGDGGASFTFTGLVSPNTSTAKSHTLWTLRNRYGELKDHGDFDVAGPIPESLTAAEMASGPFLLSAGPDWNGNQVLDAIEANRHILLDDKRNGTHLDWVDKAAEGVQPKPLSIKIGQQKVFAGVKVVADAQGNAPTPGEIAIVDITHKGNVVDQGKFDISIANNNPKNGLGSDHAITITPKPNQQLQKGLYRIKVRIVGGTDRDDQVKSIIVDIPDGV